MAIGGSANSKRIVLLLWLLVAFFYFYLSYDYIRVTMSDRQFADYLLHVVQIAGNEHKPAREVRALLLVKAEDLALPIRGEEIAVLESVHNLQVNVNQD